MENSKKSKKILNSLEELKNSDLALVIKIGRTSILKTERDLWSHFEGIQEENRKNEFQRALEAQIKFRKINTKLSSLSSIFQKYLVMSQIRYEKWREKKV